MYEILKKGKKQLTTERYIKEKAKGFMGSILNFLMPALCPSCTSKLAREEEMFCTKCTNEIEQITYAGNQNATNICHICGHLKLPITRQIGRNPARGAKEETYICKECEELNPSFTKARSYCVYNERVGKMVSMLKYKDRTDLVKPIAKLIHKAYQEEFANAVKEDEAQIITGIPMDKSGIRKRMYNQSIMLAKALTKEIKKSKPEGSKGKDPRFVHNLLSKTRRTEKQTKLPRSGRLINLKQAMVASLPKKIGLNTMEKLNILIVDDIITTGATIEEAARAIKELYPNATVNAISLARTLKPSKENGDK